MKSTTINITLEDLKGECPFEYTSFEAFAWRGSKAEALIHGDLPREYDTGPYTPTPRIL